MKSKRKHRPVSRASMFFRTDGWFSKAKYNNVFEPIADAFPQADVVTRGERENPADTAKELSPWFILISDEIVLPISNTRPPLEVAGSGVGAYDPVSYRDRATAWIKEVE